LIASRLEIGRERGTRRIATVATESDKEREIGRLEADQKAAAELEREVAEMQIGLQFYFLIFLQRMVPCFISSFYSCQIGNEHQAVFQSPEQPSCCEACKFLDFSL
jgi:hypothetical protein